MRLKQEMLLLANNLAEARLKIWCFHTAFHAVHFMQHLVIFMATTAFLVPVPPFSVVVENLLDPEDILSFQNLLSPALPFHSLLLAGNSFVGFPRYPSNKNDFLFL